MQRRRSSSGHLQPCLLPPDLRRPGYNVGHARQGWWNYVKVIPVNDEGDIRLPVDMRRALGLDEGVQVLVEQDGDHLIIRPIRARQRPEGFLGVFKGKVADTDPASCDIIERAMVEETLDRSGRNV